MLQWFKYSTHPNGSTLYTEKSHTFKNDWNPFLSIVFHNDWLQNHHRFSLRKMAPNFEAVVSVLLQICGQLCRGMPYPCIFVEEVVPLLGAMTNKLVLTFVCDRNKNISNDLVKVATKIESAKFFACELWVERVGTFGVVLYRNQ